MDFKREGERVKSAIEGMINRDLQREKERERSMDFERQECVAECKYESGKQVRHRT